MPLKKKAKVSRVILAKAREILAFAEERVGSATDCFEFSNALFSATGKASLAFETEAERTAFCKTQEYKRIIDLVCSLPRPPVTEHMYFTTLPNGEINVRTVRVPAPATVTDGNGDAPSTDKKTNRRGRKDRPVR